MTGQFKWLRRSEISDERALRVPLSIYVLWHPAFSDGASLARAIAEWCSGGPADIRATGQGIPVHFRSDSWHASNALRDEDKPPVSPTPNDPVAAYMSRRNVWRRPIELDEAEHNVFVPLVDDHLVEDRDLWMVRPSVVAVAMSGQWSRLIGELGTVPAIMWRPHDPDHAAEILDQVFREALIAEFQLLYSMLASCAGGSIASSTGRSARSRS